MNGEQIEAINRARLEVELIGAGWTPMRPAFDRGIDLGAFNEETSEFRPIQLKGRMTLDRRYTSRGLWLAWPAKDRGFYWLPHDALLERFLTSPGAETRSWLEKGKYSWPSLSVDWRAFLEPHRV